MNAHLPRTTHILAALIALSTVVAVACSGDDDPTPTPTASTAPDGGGGTSTASGAGTFIFEGERLNGPYNVSSSGPSVMVNGETILTLGRVTPNAPDLNAPIEDAFDLADHAAAAYETAGGGSSGLEAARDAIAGEPALASAAVDLEAGELAITDISGLEVFFIPEPPDNAVRARSDAELEADAASLATEWAALLGGGGLILVPSDGPMLNVAGAAAAELVAQIDEAMGLGGSERETRLLELLTHGSVVAELIDRYEPAQARALPGTAPGSTSVTASVAAGANESIAYRAGDGGSPASVSQAGGREIAQTPGKPEAYIFTTLPGDGDARPFFDVVKQEGYTVWVYQATIRAFGGRGWDNFLTTSGTGALYLATHGSPRGVSVESFANQDAAAAVHQRLSQAEAGNFYWWREADGTWWLAITIQGLQQHWQSNNSIVHAAICKSNSLNAGFRAREYFAYEPTTTCAIATPDTTLLWQRMAGIQGQGQFRPASVAFAQGGFSAGFRYEDGSPAEGTVLSPGVVEFVGPTLAIGEEGIVVITFDAILDRTVPAQSLVRLVGCAQPTAEATYTLVGNFGAPEFGITIPVKANEAGETSVTVIAANTKSPGKIFLDGNQKPEGSNRVADNRDDYVNKLTCTSSVIETEPTPIIDFPEESANAIAVVDETTLPPAGKVLAFYLDGVFYSAVGMQSIDAHEPFCSYRHVHGGPAQPIKPAGGSPISEHLGECGYGPPNFYLIDAP